MKCKSGQHEWMDRTRAQRCCDPEWERCFVPRGESIDHLDTEGRNVTADGTFGWRKRSRMEAALLPQHGPVRQAVEDLLDAGHRQAKAASEVTDAQVRVANVVEAMLAERGIERPEGEYSVICGSYLITIDSERPNAPYVSLAFYDEVS